MPLNNYSDPNAVWRRTGYDPYKGMTEDEMTKVGCLQGAAFVGIIILALVIYVILS